MPVTEVPQSFIAKPYSIYLKNLNFREAIIEMYPWIP
jgi:hypothetical protein